MSKTGVSVPSRVSSVRSTMFKGLPFLSVEQTLADQRMEVRNQTIIAGSRKEHHPHLDHTCSAVPQLPKPSETQPPSTQHLQRLHKSSAMLVPEK